MKLIVEITPNKYINLESIKDTAIVGRSSESDIIIPHESISKQHCQIDCENGFYYITDLDSTNGTFIAGKRIPARNKTPFPTNSQLTIGKLKCQLSKSSRTLPKVSKPSSKDLKLPSHQNITLNMRSKNLNSEYKTTSGVRNKKIPSKRLAKKRQTTSRAHSKTKNKKEDSQKIYIFLFILVSIVVVSLILKALD